MKLFDNAYESEELPKRPTLKQYLKNSKGKNRPKRHLLRVLWRPNKYDSFGVETEHFRTNVTVQTSLGIAIGEFLESYETITNKVYVIVTTEENDKYSLSFVLSKEKGSFSEIGDSLGVKLD